MFKYRYEATIIKTVITTIEVMSNGNPTLTKDNLQNYGLVEAANDYKVLDEVILTKLTKCVKTKRYQKRIA